MCDIRWSRGSHDGPRRHVGRRRRSQADAPTPVPPRPDAPHEGAPPSRYAGRSPSGLRYTVAAHQAENMVTGRHRRVQDSATRTPVAKRHQSEPGVTQFHHAQHLVAIAVWVILLQVS